MLKFASDMEPACCLCQTEISFHESLKDERQNSLLQTLKVVSSSDSRKHAFNLLDMVCGSQSPFEIPLCKDCATRACNDMRRQLADLENECMKYDEALQDLLAKKNLAAYDTESMKRKLQQLCTEEQELQEELKLLEEQEKRINNEVRELSKESMDVNDEGDFLYRELKTNHRKLLQLDEDKFSLNTQAKYISENLSVLTSTNVLDMTFFIWIQENYGTINGLRLGRLPHEVVEWNEINAAFGQVALLVLVLAERLGVILTDYEIEPRGNHSHIRRIVGGKVTEYPLYGQGGWKPFGQIQLDHAIVGLINCFFLVEAKLREVHKNKDLLMYRMDGDRIIENDSPYRIKMQFNSEERWTKAMKLFLLNLKRAIGLVPALPGMNSPGSSKINEKKSAENSESFLLNECEDQLVDAFGTPPILTTFLLNRERSNTYFKRKVWQLNTTYFFYLALILGQQFFCHPTNISSDYKVKKNMFADQIVDEDQSFMAGKFPASPDNDFFNPRFRWRNDAELASYAWSNYGKYQEPQINMLMTENRVAVPNRLGGCSSDGSGSGSCNIASRDPSLLDYDMIDVSWRYDIEHEKNMAPDVSYRHPNQNIYDEQYERDLQVLHDKGFMTTLSSEESNRYEELAKAQYADFYHTVARPDKIATGCSLTDISFSRPSCSFDKPIMNRFVEKKFQSVSQPTFDNITLAYMPEEQPSNIITNQYNENEQINATIRIAEDDYLEYFNSTQVIQDLSTAAVEQGQDSFEAVFHKIVDGRHDANIDAEFSPFDEPLPFFVDESFFDGSDLVDSSKTLELNTQTNERSISPSSGFVSGSERSCSPEGASYHDYRLHGKLLPENRDMDEDEPGDKFQRRRGRQSKDNDLVKKHNLPATAEELAGMSHKALQRLLKDPTLNESQKSLIKKIRRRGRNKEAARKCRERRVTPSDTSSRFVVYPPSRHD